MAALTPSRRRELRRFTPHLATTTNEAEYAKSCTLFCLPPDSPIVAQHRYVKQGVTQYLVEIVHGNAVTFTIPGRPWKW